MTVLRSLLKRTDSIENPAVPLTDTSLSGLLDGGPTASGINVTERTAMQIAAVWRAVNLIAGTGASLPLHTFRNNTRDRVDSRILAKPNPSMTRFELWEYGYMSALLWGNAYFLKRRTPAGQMLTLEPIPPEWVRVGRFKKDGKLEHILPSRKVFEVRGPSGENEVFTEVEILHIPGLGYDGICGVSPIRLARQGLGLTLAAEEYGARLFGSGSLMAGILQTEQVLEQKDAETLKRRWMQKVSGLSKAHEVAVLDRGAKFQPIGIPPGDAQFLESRRFQIAEIARWFGVTPHMLFETDRSTSWGSGIEQMSLGFVIYTIRPWLARFEQRITNEVVIDPGIYAEYAVEGLLRGDSTARAAFYHAAIADGWLNADEVRDLENRPPIPGGAGQTYLTPSNTAPTGGADAKPDPEADPGAGSAD